MQDRDLKEMQRLQNRPLAFCYTGLSQPRPLTRGPAAHLAARVAVCAEVDDRWDRSLGLNLKKKCGGEDSNPPRHAVRKGLLPLGCGAFCDWIWGVWFFEVKTRAETGTETELQY